jgi:site-specific recombinase XerD
MTTGDRPRGSESMRCARATKRSAELATFLDGVELPEKTGRIYRIMWRRFTDWCAARGSLAMPARPRLVVLYVASLVKEGLSAATIKVACAAIAKAHEVAGVSSPTDAPILLRWRRRLLAELPTEQQQVRALSAAQVQQIVRSMGDDLVAKRDRALILVGYAARLRPAELVGLNLEDVREDGAARCLLVRGRWQRLEPGHHAETCPVRALQAWIDGADLRTGALFMSISRWRRVRGRLSDRAVSLILQDRARAAGLDVTGLSADSLHLGTVDDRTLL